MNFPAELFEASDKHKFPLLFATVSGAHLYGFPSPDSDWDLRGVHILPVSEIIGLDESEETTELSEFRNNIELDLVTHDIKKFFKLLLKKNGYVLEQLYSPLIIRTSPEHDELKKIAKDCITRMHVHHYLGFANNQWNLFNKENPARIKPLLYTYRVILTGIHLMETGEIEANLKKLNETRFHLNFIDELIERKSSTKEKQTLSNKDLEFHEHEFQRMLKNLEVSGQKSLLPESAGAKPALDDLLKRVRLATT